jgi:hypothetical protein
LIYRLKSHYSHTKAVSKLDGGGNWESTRLCGYVHVRALLREQVYGGGLQDAQLTDGYIHEDATRWRIFRGQGRECTTGIPSAIEADMFERVGGGLDNLSNVES